MLLASREERGDALQCEERAGRPRDTYFEDLCS
jgi:hypothetical protein